jgi:hypothetical protein
VAADHARGGGRATAQRSASERQRSPPATPREALEGELDALAADLGDQEIAVLVALARLLAGQRAYGRLRLEEDRRDWRRERGEELADALVYGAFAEVAATLSGGIRR